MRAGRRGAHDGDERGERRRWRRSRGKTGRESRRLEKELLVVAVMCELCAGAKSSWFPYLSVVYDGARKGHSVLAWNDEEASALYGTDAVARRVREHDDGLDLPTMTETHWDNVARLFFEQNPKLAGGHSMEDLRELHFAATAMVAGYSFTLGDEEIQGMVPFWDMFNHAPPCDAHVRLNHDEKKGLQMITTRKVKKGEEVFNTYGPLRNAELLRRYGFVIPRNPHGGTTVGLADVIEAALYVNPELVDELPLRLAWLESRGLAEHARDAILGSSNRSTERRVVHRPARAHTESGGDDDAIANGFRRRRTVDDFRGERRTTREPSCTVWARRCKCSPSTPRCDTPNPPRRLVSCIKCTTVSPRARPNSTVPTAPGPPRSCAWTNECVEEIG